MWDPLLLNQMALVPVYPPVVLAHLAQGFPELDLEFPVLDLDSLAVGLDYPGSDLDHSESGPDHLVSGLDYPGSGPDHLVSGLDRLLYLLGPFRLPYHPQYLLHLFLLLTFLLFVPSYPKHLLPFLLWLSNFLKQLPYRRFPHPNSYQIIMMGFRHLLHR